MSVPATKVGSNQHEVTRERPRVSRESVKLPFGPEFTAEPLLTAKEEVQLALLIQQGKNAASKLETDSSLTPQARRALAGNVRDGQAARDRFIRANTRLAMHIAKKFTGHGIEFVDLVQYGMLGIMRALDKYDPARGCRFSTYATKWVLATVGRAAGQGRHIKIPEERQIAMRKVERERLRLLEERGCEPTNAQLAANLGMTEKVVRDLRNTVADPISLHLKVGDFGHELMDLVADSGAANPQDELCKTVVAEQLNAALNHLNEPERQVLAARYGFEDGKQKTANQVSRALGTPLRQVLQVEESAMAKLRHPSHSGLRDSLAA